MKRTLLLALLFIGCRESAEAPATGCGGTLEDPLAAIVVSAARLEDVGGWQAGLGIGHVEGDGRLVVIDTNGERHTFRARLDGTHGGLVADVSLMPQAGPFELRLPGASVTARQLLGDYSGLHVGLDVGVGFHFRDLENGSRVKVNLSGISFGIGAVPVSWEGVTLALWNDPARFVQGEGDCSFGACDEEDPDEFDDGLCEPLGAACAVGWDDCCGGTCVASDVDGIGTCRQSCGRVIADADGLHAEPYASPGCLEGESCQAVTRLPDLTLDAVVCLPRDAPLNAPCASASGAALVDGTPIDGIEDDACAALLQCLPAGSSYDGNGERDGFLALRCRLPCDPADADSVLRCAAAGEDCMTVPATVNDAETLHACAIPVPSTSAVTWAQSGGVLEAHLCDEIDGNRLCDDAAFAGVDPAAAGFAVCLAGGLDVCLSVCALPAEDVDGDGVITPGVDQETWSGLCAAGYECSTVFANELLLTPGVGTCEPI